MWKNLYDFLEAKDPKQPLVENPSQVRDYVRQMPLKRLENLVRSPKKRAELFSHKQKRFTTVVKVCNFSDDKFYHTPNYESIAKIDNKEHIMKDFGVYIRVNANGNIEDNKGYVSLTFLPLYGFAELNCFVEIIDVEGKKRFLQSFTFSKIWNSSEVYETTKECSIDRYISRSFLLENSLEFLPNDTLTLHMDITFVECFDEMNVNILIRDYVHRACFERKQGLKEYKYYFLMDSFLAELLEEE